MVRVLCLTIVLAKSETGEFVLAFGYGLNEVRQCARDGREDRGGFGEGGIIAN
jgi:hypothetical protein